MTEILRGIEASAHNLESIPKPRHVRPSIHSLVPPVLLIFLLAILISALKDSIDRGCRDRLSIVFALLFFGILVAAIISDVSDRKLITTGTCCVGEITLQNWTGGGRGGRSSEILYAFPVGGHRQMSGKGRDLTRSYFPGMKVLVFYDPNDISKNVALCCTGWRPQDREGFSVEP